MPFVIFTYHLSALVSVSFQFYNDDDDVETARHDKTPLTIMPCTLCFVAL